MRDEPHPIIKRVQRFRPTHYLRWGMIHTALIIFFADMIAAELIALVERVVAPVAQSQLNGVV